MHGWSACQVWLVVALSLAQVAAGGGFSASVNDGKLVVSPGTRIMGNGIAAEAYPGGLLSSAHDRLEVTPLRILTNQTELTAAAWVAPARAPQGYQMLLFKGDRAAAPQKVQFSLCLFDGVPELKFMDAAGGWQGIMRNGNNLMRPGREPVPLAGMPRVKSRRWHHVAGTFSRGKVAVYLDGKEVASGTCDMESLVQAYAPLAIAAGQRPGGTRDYLLPGLLDGILVQDKAMTAEGILALYEKEKVAKPDGPVAIPPDRLVLAAQHAFETKLPLVAAYETRPPLPALDTSAGVAIDRVAEGALLRIGAQLVYPMAMMPDPYVKDEEVTLSCHDFAAAGVDLYSEIFWTWMNPRDGAHSWWLGPGEYDFARIDARVHAMLAANPQALLLPRIKLNPPKWWLAAHPDQVVRYADGKPGPQVSLASREWTELYSQMLRDVISHMEKSDYANRIFGYHPAGGGTSEWFWWGYNKGAVDFSPAAIARWREWLQQRYTDDTQLARAWGSPGAAIAAAMPPPPEAREDGKGPFLRLSAASQAWIDYRQFLSDMTSAGIIHSCQVAREACGRRKIAGVFYGYSMYCANVIGFRGLQRAMACPDVQFLCSPTSYQARRGGDPGNHISAYNGSMRLHGKLYWDEADNRTHLFPGLVHYRTDTEQETLATLRRTVGHSLTRGTGLWYFLLAGNTTFHDQAIMADIAHMKAICDQAREHDRSPAAEVAVFMDEESMHYYDTRHPMAKHLGMDLLDELAQAGAPFDVYLLDDITNPALPDYKAYVFPNAFRRDDALHEAIRRKVRRNHAAVLWVYAPGFVTAAGGDLGRLRELTGMQIELLPNGLATGSFDETIRHPITSSLTAPPGHSFRLSPAFTVADRSATALVRSPGCTGVAVKEFPQWRSVYSLLPPNRELLLGFYRYAGIHIYCNSRDTIGASRDYLMIHTFSAGDKVLHLPRPCRVTELISGTVLGDGLRTIRETIPQNETRIYRLEP